ncbi:MAG: EVE domain-containing protein [Thermomicrobiales bacterium]
MAEQTNWIITGSVDNFRSTRDHGFTVQGLKSRHRKKAEKMKPGDRITWYITGIKAFGATATVTSEYFEDDTPIWKSTNKKLDEEIYPYRFNIKPDIVLDEGEFIDAEPVARQLKYVSKWPEKNWTLAFQGNIRPVDDEDFATIEQAIREASLEPAATGD